MRAAIATHQVFGLSPRPFPLAAYGTECLQSGIPVKLRSQPLHAGEKCPSLAGTQIGRRAFVELCTASGRGKYAPDARP